MLRLIFAILWAALAVLYAVFAVTSILYADNPVVIALEIVMALIAGLSGFIEFRIWRRRRLSGRRLRKAVARLSGK